MMANQQAIGSRLLREAECLFGTLDEDICEANLAQFPQPAQLYPFGPTSSLSGPITNSLDSPFNGDMKWLGNYFSQLAGYTYKVVSRTIAGNSEILLFNDELQLVDAEGGEATKFLWCGAMTGLIMMHMHATNSCITFQKPMTTTDTSSADVAAVVAFPTVSPMLEMFFGMIDVERSNFIMGFEGQAQAIGRTLSGHSPFLFLTTLGPESWLAVGVSLLLVSFTSGLSHALVNKSLTFLFRVLFDFTSMVINQSVTQFVYRRVDRVAFTFWAFAAMVLSQIFLGSLLDLMSKSYAPYVPYGFMDLLEYPFDRWTLHFIGMGIEEDLVSTADDGAVMQRFVDEKRIVIHNVFDIDLPGYNDKFMNAILSAEALVYFADSMFFSLLTPRRAGLSDEVLKSIHIAAPLARYCTFLGIRPEHQGSHPDLKPTYDRIILTSEEAGLMDFWVESQRIANYKSLPRMEKESFHQLASKDLIGISAIFTAMIIASLFISLTEQAFRPKKTSHPIRPQFDTVVWAEKCNVLRCASFNPVPRPPLRYQRPQNNRKRTMYNYVTTTM